VIDVSHVAVPSHPHLFAREFRHARGDFLLQLHQRKHIHESGFVGIVGAETDVHVENRFSFDFKDAAPDALHAGRIIAIIVFPNLPGNGLGAARVRRFRQFAGQNLDLIKDSQRRYLGDLEDNTFRFFFLRGLCGLRGSSAGSELNPFEFEKDRAETVCATDRDRVALSKNHGNVSPDIRPGPCAESRLIEVRQKCAKIPLPTTEVRQKCAKIPLPTTQDCSKMASGQSRRGESRQAAGGS